MDHAFSPEHQNNLYMKTIKRSIIRNPMAPFVVIAALAMGCSGGSAGNYENTGAAASTDVHVTPADANDRDHGGVNMAQDVTGNGVAGDEGNRYNATGTLDPTGNYTAEGTLRPGVILTPVQERTDAMERMNGIRSTLTTELEQVRATLKDGTLDKEVAAANKQRAAELAQGLERVDRTLTAMGGATDATWADMRAAELKEVDEVRTWWNQYMAGRSESAAK